MIERPDHDRGVRVRYIGLARSLAGSIGIAFWRGCGCCVDFYPDGWATSLDYVTPSQLEPEAGEGRSVSEEEFLGRPLLTSAEFAALCGPAWARHAFDYDTRGLFLRHASERGHLRPACTAARAVEARP